MLNFSVDELSISFTLTHDFNLDKISDWHIACESFMALLARELEIDSKPIKVEKKLSAYDITYHYGLDNPIKFAFHSVMPRSGMTLKFHSVALGRYLENHSCSVYEMLRTIEALASKNNLTMRVRRIDLVADFFNEKIPTVNDLYRGLRDESIVIYDKNQNINRSSVNSFENNFSANTIYIGQKKSAERFLRIYDKRVEQIENGGVHYEKAKNLYQWIRFEASYKGNLATKIGELVKSCESENDLISFIACQITNRYQFYRNGKRMELTNKLIQNIESPVPSPALTYNKDGSLEKLKDYFKIGDSGFQGLLYQIRTLEGEQAMEEYLDSLVDFQLNKYKPSDNVLQKVKRKKEE